VRDRRWEGWKVGRWVGLLAVAATFPLSDLPTFRQSRLWRPEDRVLVSDFSYVQAIAASPWLVYAATRHGLAVYDRRARRWQLPVTALDGYPTTRIRAALADVVDDAVWLGTDDGWYRYDPAIQRWEHGFVAGGVGSFILDRNDPASGIFVLGSSGWGFLPRGGLVPEPGRSLPPPPQRVQPLDPRAALAQTPMADAMRALILTDSRLRTYQFTAAARTPDQNDLFLGTSGMGVVRVDAATGQWENLSYGLLTARVDAVAVGPDGVWAIGSARAGERRGLTWVTDDAAATTSDEGALGPGFAYLAARRLVVAGKALWLATDGGVLRIDPASGRSRRFDLGSGLPSEDVLSLTPAPDGVWVGTARGLAVITADDRVVRIGTFDQAVPALLAVRESLWVGSVAGLAVLAPGEREPVVPPELAAQPALRAPIVALGRVGDTLVAVTADQLGWRDPATHTWTLVRGRADLGRVNALVADPRAAGQGGGNGVWLGGSSLLAFWDLAHGTFRTLQIPGDLPAPVRDVAVSDRYLWVATDSGLVRLERRAALGR
jgi:ligand-binding sensor domain-containing protein